MSRIRAKNTRPELALRRALHAQGYRFRVHDRALPGTPDIVFTKRKMVVFVNGCFWHSHSCRFGQVKPATRADFWASKRSATVERDARTARALNALGWKTLTVWECELRDLPRALAHAVAFLGPAQMNRSQITSWKDRH